MATHADALITGNKKHFPEAAYYNVQIVSPRDFLALARIGEGG